MKIKNRCLDIFNHYVGIVIRLNSSTKLAHIKKNKMKKDMVKETTFVDDDWNVVPENKATMKIINEYDDNGELIGQEQHTVQH